MDFKGAKESLKVKDVCIILIVVMVSQMFTYVKFIKSNILNSLMYVSYISINT